MDWADPKSLYAYMILLHLTYADSSSLVMVYLNYYILFWFSSSFIYFV